MSSQNSRRFFLQKATSSIGLVLSAPAIAALIAACERDETLPVAPPGTVAILNISTLPELAVVGGIAHALLDGINGGNPIFVSRIAQETFVVFSAICTHQGCTVDVPELAPADANCVCPCHSSEYSRTDGRVRKQPTSGRATDLPRFASTFDASKNLLTIQA